MLRHLSYRKKIPLSLSLIVFLTGSVLTVTAATRTYKNAKSELVANAEQLGGVLARSLASAIKEDAVWQAYATVKSAAGSRAEASRGPTLIVLDAQNRVFVSSQPTEFPMLSTLEDIGLGGSRLRDHFSTHDPRMPTVIEDRESDRLMIWTPVELNEARLGTLVMLYSRDLLLPPLVETIRGTVITTMVILLLLVPIGWYWGHRMATPLAHLSDCMARVPKHPPEQIVLAGFDSNDEIGQLGRQFSTMLEELREKKAMEKQMMAADRLAAVGRLAAGVAHEINNPLGGMLNALDTHKRHGKSDELTAKTHSLLERGLVQIKETVSALLVEAKLETHALSPDDVEDIRTLILPDVERKHAQFSWMNEITDALPLPSTQIRQVLINLLLNAIQAIPEHGTIACRVSMEDSTLAIVVEDNGRIMSSEELEHLFEPFTHAQTSGNGLGLWVTYQIVEQLNGDITVTSEPGETRFSASFPLAV